MIRRPVVWITISSAVLLTAAVLWMRRPKSVRAAAPEVTLWSEMPPLSRRVTVEVLNATNGNGLARNTTVRLREAGLDVVAFGGAEPAQRALPTTTIFLRRGDTLGVGRILALFPSAVVQDAPLPSLLVDLTVVLGPDAVGAPTRPR